MPNVEQYSAARCALNTSIYMYGCSSCSGVEAMNAANREMCERTSVCLVNATMLLLRMEAEQFDRMRVAAWQHEGALTPHGRLLVDKCSAEVPNHCDYTITRETHDTFHEYRYKETIMDHRLRQCVLIKMPCMAAVVWSTHVALPRLMAFPAGMSWLLKIVNAMPYWWTTRCWRSQFQKDEVSHCKIDT
jgi:hypothetical protein